MNLQEQPQELLLTLCGWCHRVIGENEEHFARAAKARAEAQEVLRAKEGQVVVFQLAEGGHEVLAIVPRADSPAKKKGYDLIFQTCSDTCDGALLARMKSEMNLEGIG